LDDDELLFRGDPGVDGDPVDDLRQFFGSQRCELGAVRTAWRVTPVRPLPPIHLPGVASARGGRR
jgi:hypothetical protein